MLLLLKLLLHLLLRLLLLRTILLHMLSLHLLLHPLPMHLLLLCSVVFCLALAAVVWFYVAKKPTSAKCCLAAAAGVSVHRRAQRHRCGDVRCWRSAALCSLTFRTAKGALAVPEVPRVSFCRIGGGTVADSSSSSDNAAAAETV